MNKDEQKAIVLQFNEYINKQKIDELATLMTDDHTFIDSANNIIHGKEKTLEAWGRFFAFFPDYRNIFEDFQLRNGFVVIIGHSICSDKRLDGPVLWKARVKGNKVAEWHVYDCTSENRKQLDIR
ncbi:nuclear transport factor 2 family protein [Methanosarcina sp. T3]|uniref:nuclear transport factor 2 family protein n=1 Tax=Methanosarcina sp. T3 TaxID=3439062 RepID=UPI003F8551C0